MVMLTSCGLQESLRDDCGSDIKMLCGALFGYKDKGDIDDLMESNKLHETRLTLLERRLELLEQTTRIDIDTISQGLDALRDEVTSEVGALESSIKLLDTAIQLLASQSQVDTIEQVISTIQNRLDALESIESSHVEIVEVCPQVSGDNIEVVLKVDGEFMSLFDGTVLNIGSLVQLPLGLSPLALVGADGLSLTNLTRFVKLNEVDNYTTTDGRNVVFSVDNGEIVCQ